MSLQKFSFKDIAGNVVEGTSFQGKKVLIVNTASECGYTPQFGQLEELYQTFREKDFVILGFPSNDFGKQDPGTNEEIAAFCQKNYGVSFPMMEKVTILGDNKHPLFAWLEEETGKEVKWNFEKFLIDEQGNFKDAFSSEIIPLSEEIINWISGEANKD